ncbi:hypothetical protein DWZ33_17340 [Dielma fastidiosa]|nr:hypothetical protein DWZ33_17340 [Dielma fastidiosa]
MLSFKINSMKLNISYAGFLIFLKEIASTCSICFNNAAFSCFMDLLLASGFVKMSLENYF